ncbi:MAG: nucleotide exchange factor GrpE [Eubacteriales bacterium]|nr:nucleotide exchange factor GrpE [Eubacteriales bacterium]
MAEKKKKNNAETEEEKDLPVSEEETQTSVEEKAEKKEKKEKKEDKKEEKTEEKSEAAKESEELAKAKDMFVRLAADFDNYKKRAAAEKTALRGVVVADTVQMMLPILDNLERAVDAAAEENSPLKDGVVMVLNQAKTSFENFGITSFGERGEKFDPEIHNAIMTCRDDELEPDTIAKVLQKGYKINDRIIRHALVQVVSEQ